MVCLWNCKWLHTSPPDSPPESVSLSSPLVSFHLRCLRDVVSGKETFREAKKRQTFIFNMTSSSHPLENILGFIPFGHRFPFPIEINIVCRTLPVDQVHQVWILLGFLYEWMSHQFFSTRSVLWILVQASFHELLELLREVAGQLGRVVLRDQEKDSHWMQIRVGRLPLQMNKDEKEVGTVVRSRLWDDLKLCKGTRMKKKLELSSRVDCEMIWNLCKF